jgi:hypothetical protein
VIADLSPLAESCYDEFYADYDSDDLLGLGRAEEEALFRLKQMEFSLKQFAKRMGQPNFAMFSKWKKV